MKKLKNYLLSSAGLLLFISVIALSVPQTGHSSMATDKDVRVINRPTEAVPVAVQGTTNVAGNVSISNVPTVEARQNGAWNVGITGTPTVQVGNSETTPVFVRDVDRPTDQPFQQEVVVTVNDGEGGQNGFITVPAGKLFVVEQVSALGTAPADQTIENVAVLTRIVPDLTQRQHYLNITKQESANINFYRVSQQVKHYGNGSVGVRFSRFPAVGTVTFRFTVSGYFVNN